MQPDPLRFTDLDCEQFGELDKYNELHDRGIRLYQDGGIYITYFGNGKLSTGNYIHIKSDGPFRVGEKYIEDEVK